MLSGPETSEGDAASSQEAMRRRCRSLVDSLVLPVPCTPQALVAAVAEHTKTTIDMQPQDFSADPKLSAMVVGTPTGYVMRYQPSPDWWWVLICISHEIGHILAGHTSPPPAPPQRASRGEPNALDEHLDDLRLARAEWGPLYRCDSQSPQEQEAEFIASLLVQRIETTRSSSLAAHLLGTRGPDTKRRSLLSYLRRPRG